MSDTVKNTTLQLTLSPEYLKKSWGLQEALRELIQNGIDGQKDGYPLTVKYATTKDGTGGIVISNQGAIMTRKHLLMGNTTKTNSDRLGQFGEGFKLAWLCLLREGYKVWTKVGNEIWKPFLEYSSEFNDTLMKVKISGATAENAIVVKVLGVTKDDYVELVSRCLFLSPPKKYLEDSTYGRVLLEEKYKGKLFVGGLFVGSLNNAKYGYDLINLQLDRDRKVPSFYALSDEIGNLWGKLGEYNKIKFSTIEDILNEPSSLEAQSCDSIWNSSFIEGFAEYFESKHGKDVFAVSSTQEQAEAAHYGLTTVIVEQSIKKLLSRSGKENFEAAKKKTLKRPKKYYNLSELDFEEDVNWMNSCSLVESFIPDGFELKIVDFVKEELLGLYCGMTKEILIAKKLLKNPRELFVTLVHEIAHTHGADGTVQHLNRMCDIFSRVVYKGE